MFKIKLSTVLSIAAGAGVVVTGFLAARGGRKAAKAEEETRKDIIIEHAENGDFTCEEFAEEVKDALKKKKVWKHYIPAIISGIVTLGCGAYAKRLDTKEIIKLTGAVGFLTTRLEKVVGDFAAYRDATIEEIGVEKEAEIRAKAAEGLVKSSLNGIEEKEYVFHIDWVGGKDMFFKATPMQVMKGMYEINHRLNDDIFGYPEPTVSDFFYAAGIPEVATNETDQACWDREECEAMESWWVGYDIIPYGRQDFTDEKPEYYDISIDMYPNGYHYNTLKNAERAGTM